MRLTKHLLPAASHATPARKYYRLLISCCIVLLSFAAHAQQVVGAPDTTNFEKVFVKVEREARFPGGAAAWKHYLERNLDGDAPVKDKAKPGIYSVKLQFIVGKDGVVRDVKAINGPAECPSCVASAIKVIQRGPRWEPAEQGGRNVIYQALQVISFMRQ
jgi:hypothetical protein